MTAYLERTDKRNKLYISAQNLSFRVVYFKAFWHCWFLALSFWVLVIYSDVCISLCH